MSNPDLVIGQGAVPVIPDTSLWKWDTSTIPATPIGFPVSGTAYSQTKTNLGPTDLDAFVGVPLLYYNTTPPTVVAPEVKQQWIRNAEDRVEQETSILLCQTWVASPPSPSLQVSQALGIQTNSSTGAQVRGFDYDLEDAAYDFMFPRAQDEGWMYQTLRYRPVQSVTYNVSGNAATQGITAVKNTAFIYPLLNVYFRMPPGWNVEDRDYGLIRYVPATNVQMLPLFAMQLAFMGFAESVPGAMWLQYTAGLTDYDYRTRYSFMKQLVLCEAAITALTTIQGTINMGMEASQLTVDGLSYRAQYYKDGPFGPLIKQFTARRNEFMKIAQTKVSGPMVNSW